MKLRALTHSIRWRLLFWLAFLLVGILGGFGVTAHQLNRVNRLSQVDEALLQRVAALNRDLRGRPGFGPRERPPWEPAERDRAVPRPPPEMPPLDDWMDGDRPPREPAPLESRRGPLDEAGFPDFGLPPPPVELPEVTLRLFDQTDTNGFYFAIWRSDGSPWSVATNAPLDLSPPSRAGDAQLRLRTRGAFREAFHLTERGDCILAGRSIAPEMAASRRFAGWLVLAGTGVLAAGLLGAWFLAGGALRPVEAIGAAASRISASTLSERIRADETDSELGRLVGVLNSAFARLEAAFAEQRQFTADASHELRTPIAVLISETQAALNRERSAVEYRETVETCLATAQQMRRLTQSLLELARFDAGQAPLARTPFDLAECARDCADLIRPIAAEHGLRVACHLAQTPTVGDADRCAQVIVNLLHNAVEHSDAGGEVTVTTSEEPAEAVLSVSDTGRGIAPEDLPHIFERFYRADKSRARAGGQAGLGLAICKAIVDAHGGRIDVESEPGKGTRFTVRLPR